MQYLGGLRSRAGGLFILALLVVVTVLLIAGYGVAVGIGALAGFLAALIFGTVSLLWLARGPGRSIHVSGMEWQSERAGLEPDFLSEMQQVGELSTVDIGRVRAVLPVLTTAEADGFEVQLTSVEIHDAGLAIVMVVRRSVGTYSPASMARVRITDDVGSTYTAAAQGDGGSVGASRYTITAIPGPPTTATRLEIKIERFFDPFPMGREQAAGPWTFTVPLRAREG